MYINSDIKTSQQFFILFLLSPSVRKKHKQDKVLIGDEEVPQPLRITNNNKTKIKNIGLFCNKTSFGFTSPFLLSFAGMVFNKCQRFFFPFSLIINLYFNSVDCILLEIEGKKRNLNENHNIIL